MWDLMWHDPDIGSGFQTRGFPTKAEAIESADRHQDIEPEGSTRSWIVFHHRRDDAVYRTRPHRTNPGELLVFGPNPGGVPIGKDVDSIRYQHITEGSRIHHMETPDVRMEGLPDGSLRIYHATERLWRDS